MLHYIHQNPVKAGLVSNTEDYKWSSYNEYYKTSNIVDTNFALQMFSSDKKEAVAEFGKFHIEITDSRCLDIDEEKKTPSTTHGDGAFVLFILLHNVIV